MGKMEVLDLKTQDEVFFRRVVGRELPNHNSLKVFSGSLMKSAFILLLRRYKKRCFTVKLFLGLSLNKRSFLVHFISTSTTLSLPLSDRTLSKLTDSYLHIFYYKIQLRHNNVVLLTVTENYQFIE
jgi:hypothetical protein